MLKLHCFPPDQPRQGHYAVTAGGRRADVISTAAGEIVSAEADTAVELVVRSSQPWREVAVRPLRLGVDADVSGKVLRLKVPAPANLVVQSLGQPDLFLYFLPPVAPPVGLAAKGCRVFAAGRRHEVGTLDLASGDSVFLEGGAVLVGRIRARHAEGVRISGPGVIDGEDRSREAGGGVGIELNHCRDARIDDLLMIRPGGWMCRLGGCQGVAVHGLRQISNRGGTDGVDVVGSRNILIENCFLRNGDDNIAIKALNRKVMSAFVRQRRGGRIDPEDSDNFARDVRDVTVRGCAFLNSHGGSAMEIGYETRCAEISGILFEDIDVMGVHGHGSVFGIHNGDEADVHHVTWRDIRVEHHYDKLIDFRILSSRWNSSRRRGQIHDVAIEDVRIVPSTYNPGYTLSVIAGWDDAHAIARVTLDNVRCGPRRLRSATDLDLVTRHAREVVIR